MMMLPRRRRRRLRLRFSTDDVVEILAFIL